MKLSKFSISLALLGLVSFFAQSQVRTSVNSGSFSSPLTWDCFCIPSSTNDIVISNGDNVSLISNTTVNNLTIESGATLNNNGRRIDINGNYTISGEHTGSGAIRFLGVNSVLDGNGLISTGSNVDIRANGISLRDTAHITKNGGGSFRIIGAITFTNYGYFETTRNITRNNASSIWHNASGATVVAGNGFMNNNQIDAGDPGNTVIYNRLGNQTIRRPLNGEYNNLILQGTGNKTLSGNIVVNNDLQIEGGTFRTNALDVDLKGNYTNTGALLNPGSGEFLFTGSADQHISALAEETFYDFTINKSGGQLILEQNVVVSNMLSMINGDVDARNNPLTLGTGTGNIGTLTHSSGHVLGTYSKWINTGTTSYLFPLGDASNYLPALLNFTSVVNGRLNGRFSSAFAGSQGLPLGDGVDTVRNTFSEGYWRFSDTSGVSGSVFNVQITANGFSSYSINPSTRLIFRSNPSSNWQLLGSHIPASNPTVFRNAVNSLPIDVALGDTTKCLLPSPNTSVISGLSTVCKSASNVNYSVLNTPGSIYYWSVTGGSQISGGNTNSISVDWGSAGVTGNVEVIEYNGCEYGNPVSLSVEIQPADPIQIFGQDPAYEGTTGNLYYIEEHPGNTYNWTVSGAGTRVGSGSNDSIFVDFLTSGTADFMVYLSNGCGNSDTLTKAITVSSAIKSVQTGQWTSSSTWDCNCNPGNNSSVQIMPGHTVTSGANGERVYAVLVESGGTFNVTGSNIRISNLLSNQGTITGSGQIRMNQTGSLINGAGSWSTHSGSISFQSGTHTISPEVNIQKTGNIALSNNSSVLNEGIVVTSGTMTGTNSAYWEQKTNSVLQVGNLNWSNGDFLAFADGNLVTYSSTGNFTRNVRLPNSSQYYNLKIDGSGTGSVYRLNNADIEVLGDLSIEGGTFDVGAANYNVTLYGDWLNTGGTFNPRNAVVTFNGADQQIQHSTRENFYDLNIYSGGTASSLAEIEVRNQLKVDLSSTLDMNSGINFQLNVRGDILNYGQINLYNNELLLDGSALQSVKGDLTTYDLTIDNSSGVNIDSGTVNVRNALDINAGQLDTKNNMVFISNATETAMLADMTGGGSITGDVKVQRYLNEGNGWYLLSSPVIGADIEDWNTEVYMSGFPGSDGSAQGFVSVQTYSESSRTTTGDKDEGFTPPTNTSNVIGAGDGYFVYYQFVKPGVLANTLDINGPLFTGSYNTGTLSHTVNGTTDDRGWHLIGNPYAAPVDFSLLSISNIVNSTGYVKGASGNYLDIVNDNVDYLYSSESMWVKVDVGGGSVAFDESDKAVVNDDYNARKAKANIFKDPLKVILSSSTYPGYSDYAVLRFGGDSNTVNYDPVFGESMKLSNSYGYYPNIASFSLADSSNVYYNTLNPADSNQSIPLNVYTDFPSNTLRTYSLEFEGIHEWNMNNHCLMLHDSLNSVFTKIDSGNNTYSFSMIDTLKTPKIFIIHSSPISSNMQAVSCNGNNDGKIIAKGSGGNGFHNYKWFDAFGNLIKSDSNHGASSVLQNLPSGKYSVEVSDNGQCGTMHQYFELSEPDPVISDFSSPDVVSKKDTVEFTNTSKNALKYEWDFGDGQTSTDENPKHIYQNKGIYTVTLNAKQSDDCYTESKNEIEVVDYTSIPEIEIAYEIACYSFEDRIILKAENAKNESLQISVYNELGQLILKKGFRESVVNEEFKMTSTNAIVLVRIEKFTSSGVKSHSKKLLIEQ